MKDEKMDMKVYILNTNTGPCIMLTFGYPLWDTMCRMIANRVSNKTVSTSIKKFDKLKIAL